MIRVLVFGFLVACGGKPADQREPALVTFERRMCECKDSACATRVVQDFAAWSKRQPTQPQTQPGVAAEIMKRYNACMKALANK